MLHFPGTVMPSHCLRSARSADQLLSLATADGKAEHQHPGVVAP